MAPFKEIQKIMTPFYKTTQKHLKPYFSFLLFICNIKVSSVKLLKIHTKNDSVELEKRILMRSNIDLSKKIELVEKH